jgi:uncharacterized lipoprotein YddW (UPF0748 family)
MNMNRRLFGTGCLATLAAGLSGIGPALAEPIARNAEFIGVWISPDWLFPGTQRYSEAQVRSTARRVMSNLAGQGVSDVFFESFLRGQSIAPAAQARGRSVTLCKDPNSSEHLALYPHLAWDFRVEVDSVVDTLGIFIDEGRSHGLSVHAWIHTCYWTQDVPSVMLDWHEKPSEWSRLFVDYLEQQGRTVAGTADLALAAAELLRITTSGERLSELLKQHQVTITAGPMAALIRELVRRGCSMPSFLLTGSIDDAFPAPRNSRLRPIYVNPEHPAVQDVVLKTVRNLVRAHPRLAGIHLDHIRYPVDGQGMPESMAISNGSYRFYSQIDNAEMDRFQQIQEVLRRREGALKGLVTRVRAEVPKDKRLSAAVLPAYYRERDNGRFRLCGYDFASQDWVSWPVDFVVPMLYEMSAFTIRNLLDQMANEMDTRFGKQSIVIYPGVSQQSLGRRGELETPGWVFFDLKQARDFKVKHKERSEDLNFEPQ